MTRHEVVNENLSSSSDTNEHVSYNNDHQFNISANRKLIVSQHEN
jgi:hypothetical protein